MKVYPPTGAQLESPWSLLLLLTQFARAINEAEHTAGPTTDRPRGADLRIGRMYFDTTLGLPIWWKGTAWVNATGVSA